MTKLALGRFPPLSRGHYFQKIRSSFTPPNGKKTDSLDFRGFFFIYSKIKVFTSFKLRSRGAAWTSPSKCANLAPDRTFVLLGAILSFSSVVHQSSFSQTSKPFLPTNLLNFYTHLPKKKVIKPPIALKLYQGDHEQRQ